MKKKNYIIIGALLALVVIAILQASSFIFHEDEKEVCAQCKMLNCHEHANSNYCCDMCDMGNGTKCDCSMQSMEMNNSDNASNIDK